MDMRPSTGTELRTRLGKIVRRMQRVQQSIQASRQPASRFELIELENLGREYARIVQQLADLQEADPG
jgi:hypothetical protein